MDKEHTALYDLLIESCRHAPDANQLEAFAQKIDDWKGFLDSAYAHGVFPLVHKSLKSITAVPDDIKLRLKSTNLEIARRNMTMTAELLKIMKHLEENGIPALAIKGPVLSQMIYGDVTQRQFSDLDILLDQDNLYRVVELLCANGFVSEQPIKFLKNKTLLEVLKDFSVIKPIQNISVEIHWRLFLKSQIQKEWSSNLFQSQNNLVINNSLIRTLDNNSLFLYLILHGSKHLWERLEWIVDIDRLARSIDIDWDDLLIIVQAMKSERLFSLGITTCYELFKTPFPINIIRDSEAMSSVVNAKGVILYNLFHNTILHSDPVLHDEINYLFFEDTHKPLVMHKLTLLYRAFARLDPSDLYTINLPVYLAFLYRVIHVFNVVQRMIFHKKIS